MRKKILLMFAILAMAINASAYDFCVDGIYYNYLSQDDLTCEVTRGDKNYSGAIVIPSTVTYNGKTYSVTSIGDFAFYNCSSLTSVMIPNSVTEIEYCAFADCVSLPSVDIPNSVTSIGEGAFGGCSSLESFSGKFASEDNRCLIVDDVLKSFAPAGLTSYEIPNSVTSIEDLAFCYCSSLLSVEIPNSVTSIGRSAFQYCSSLTSVEIPNSVTSIGRSAFNRCSSLTSLVIGNSVTEIGEYAFYSCSSLKEITSLAVTPPSICPDTFYDVPKTECVLMVPEESVEAYKTAPYWADFFNIVGINAADISTPSANDLRMSTKAYNLSGTEANDSYRGIVIKNGKKMLRK